MRLQKFLAKAGVCSRRKAEDIILAKRVMVDGELVAVLGTKIDPDNQTVLLDGKPVRLQERFACYLLNKPKGYLTTMSDPFGRKTIKDLIKEIPYRVFPVGRLDLDSEGLILLTNWGELAHRLQHPNFKVEKTYHVTVKGKPSKKDIEILSVGGLEIENRPIQPCKIKIISSQRRTSLIEVRLKEGRKRQIRLMFKHIQHPIIKLVRTAIGPLKLDGIPKGRFRELTTEEKNAIINIAKLDSNNKKTSKA